MKIKHIIFILLILVGGEAFSQSYNPITGNTDFKGLLRFSKYKYAGTLDSVLTINPADGNLLFVARSAGGGGTGVDSITINPQGLLCAWSAGLSTCYPLGNYYDSVALNGDSTFYKYYSRGVFIDSIWVTKAPIFAGVNFYITDTTVIVNGNPVRGYIFNATSNGTAPGLTFQWLVKDSLSTPAVAPDTGSIYLVGTSPTGAFVTHANQIATFNGATYSFQTASSGNLLYNAGTGYGSQLTSGTWVRLGPPVVHWAYDEFITGKKEFGDTLLLQGTKGIKLKSTDFANVSFLTTSSGSSQFPWFNITGSQSGSKILMGANNSGSAATNFRLIADYVDSIITGQYRPLQIKAYDILTLTGNYGGGDNVARIVFNHNGTPTDTAAYFRSSGRFYSKKGIDIVDGTQGAGKVFTSDANGVGSWQTLPSSGVTASNLLTKVGSDIQLGGTATKSDTLDLNSHGLSTLNGKVEINTTNAAPIVDFGVFQVNDSAGIPMIYANPIDHSAGFLVWKDGTFRSGINTGDGSIDLTTQSPDGTLQAAITLYGNDGNIDLTSTNYFRTLSKNFLIKDSSVFTASNGYVFTLMDNITGRGAWQAGGGGSGTVTSVSRTNGLGISASVANSTTTPNITIGVDTSDASILSRQRAEATYVSKDSSARITLTSPVNGDLLQWATDRFVNFTPSYTGTGGFVRDNTPTLITPNIGVATATSINGNFWTAGTGTLTIAAGKTLTINNSLTFVGQDATTLTFPSGNATIARNDASQTFTGTQTMAALAVTGNMTAGTTSSNIFLSTGSSLGTAVSNTQYIIGANNVQFRLGIRGSTNSTATLNDVAAFVVGDNTNTTASSAGVHALWSGAVFKKQTITAGTATVTDGQAAYFESAGSGATNNYSINTGYLHMRQGVDFAYIAKTGAYTATSQDCAINCTSGTFQVTLPTAVGCTGRVYYIFNSGAGTITVGTTSSQTFTNVVGTPTSIVMAAVGTTKVLSTGAAWLVL